MVKIVIIYPKHSIRIKDTVPLLEGVALCEDLVNYF